MTNPSTHSATYEAIRVGRTFDTPAEQGCVVASEPDLDGNFDAYDSDGVLCSFSPIMVLRWTDAE